MRITGFIFTLFVSFFIAAQAYAAEDVAGSQDFPEIGRYPGSFIINYKANEYTTFTYPVQALLSGGVKEHKASFKTAEGERTAIVYEVPKAVTTSILKVYRSIEKSLVSKGFETIFSCGGEREAYQDSNCGEDFMKNTFTSTSPYYSRFTGMKSLDHSSSYFVYVGSLSKNNERYIAVIVVANFQNKNNIEYLIDVVKESELELEDLVLTVDAMSEQIKSSGAVTLGGLYFDNNEASLTEDSQPALRVIAEYLSNNNGAKYLVVGHTDNMGDFNYNRSLSEDRAKSVITSLTSLLDDQSSVELSSFGAAYSSPVDSNEAEEGRANNRRVELVLISPVSG